MLNFTRYSRCNRWKGIILKSWLANFANIVVGVNTIDLVIRVRAIDGAVFHPYRTFLKLQYIDISLPGVILVINQAVFKHNFRFES